MSLSVMLDIILYVLFICGILTLAFWRFYFIRDPMRKTPRGKSIISPADGRVVNIEKYDLTHSGHVTKGLVGKIKTRLLDISEEGYIVSIFMNIFDVHVNRAPIAGEIVYQRHTKGKFYPAFFAERALIDNEKNEVIIQNDVLKIKVIQIAGLIAKRIQSYVDIGSKLKKGQRFGMINMGSQVTLILPKDVDITVALGQRVKAGETVIGTK